MIFKKIIGTLLTLPGAVNLIYAAIAYVNEEGINLKLSTTDES